MAQLTHNDYEILERALAKGTRVRVRRRGRQDYLITPLGFRASGGRELIETRNPTTGHPLTIFLDEVDSIEAAL
ncbi:MAG TPA: hypothetical protein VGM82_17210 [Gemmatimonadaceae bacterium]|jgi:hypothetical protein